MADNFSDRYWSTQYWTVRYFQAGEIDPNAMSASLSGTGSITADLTAAGDGSMTASLSGAGTISATLAGAGEIHQGGHDNLWLAKKRKKRKAIVKEEEIVYIDDDEALVAFVEAFLRDAA
jgi:hypothetical protein